MEKKLKDNIWKINSTCLKVRCELKNDIKEAVTEFAKLLDEEHEYCYLIKRYKEIFGDFTEMIRK